MLSIGDDSQLLGAQYNQGLFLVHTSSPEGVSGKGSVSQSQSGFWADGLLSSL